MLQRYFALCFISLKFNLDLKTRDYCSSNCIAYMLRSIYFIPYFVQLLLSDIFCNLYHLCIALRDKFHYSIDQERLHNLYCIVSL